MRYVLTASGVPVGYLHLAGSPRTCGDPHPYAAFFDSGLAEVAGRFGTALVLSHGPRARPNPRQRRLRREAHAEQSRWQPRLGLLDQEMRLVTTGLIRLFSFPGQRPMAVIDFRSLPAPIGARVWRRLVRARERLQPAA